MKNSLNSVLPSVIVLIFCVSVLKAQTQLDTIDSVQSRDTIQEEKSFGLFDMFAGNPGKAALYSLVLPGAGQAYNKQYWKVPLALAAEGVTIFILIDNIRTYQKWNNEWAFQLANGTNNPDVTTVYDPSAIKNIRDNARQQKDYAWVALIGVHLIVTAEAFISRHLIEFDVDDDLSFRIQPSRYSAGVAVVINF